MQPQGHKIVGDLLENGKISYKTENGVVTYDSPSTWATFVKKGINPQKKSGCGWNSVKYNVGKVYVFFVSSQLSITVKFKF